MGRFIQLHMLTSYPPSNLNRDDLGRPKTAVMGGELRLRISSQSLKRAWRTSDVFESALAGHIGTRTKRVGVEVYNDLVAKGVSKKIALESARQIAGCFGALESSKEKSGEKNEAETGEGGQAKIKQLAHISPEERAAIDKLAQNIADTKKSPGKEGLSLLREKHTASDIALFGRMLADSPKFNVEAAAQVAHAITVHSVVIEDDYFTAVDDLNRGDEDQGAGHLGETEFAAGLFYLYACINKEALIENLGGGNNAKLAQNTLRAFIEAMATVAPTGKQNSFASRARASFILCEKGSQQPRALSVAYLDPIESGNMLNAAIDTLLEKRDNMDKVYGPCADQHRIMNAETGDGALKEIIDFAASD